MKLSEVSYVGEKLERLQGNELIEVNLQAIIRDFEKKYSDVFEQEMPEEIPESHLKNLKSDLLTAFAYGMEQATDTKSEFRKHFKLPKKVMENLNNIVLPNEGIVTPEKKIIT